MPETIQQKQRAGLRCCSRKPCKIGVPAPSKCGSCPLTSELDDESVTPFSGLSKDPAPGLPARDHSEGRTTSNKRRRRSFRENLGGCIPAIAPSIVVIATAY